jgi:hypothetical protein
VGTLYIATPKTSNAITEVATSAAVKTVLQILTPSTTDIRVHGWGISFKGISATAEPGNVVLVDVDVAATTGTSLTPDKWESDDAPSSLCVGGTGATGYGFAAEGTITASRFLDAQAVHPQTGYGVWFPEGRRPKAKASRSLRIRTTFDVDINCIPWCVWEEPA